MAKNKNLVRKNVYIPEFVNEWLEQEAEKRGISQSNVISLTLQEAMKQDKAIDTLGNMDKLITELKKLKEA